VTDKVKQMTAERDYGQEVHEQAFYLWFKLNKPDMKVVAKALGQMMGKVPSIHTLTFWKRVDNWDEHADTLEGVADNAMDKIVVQQRAELIKRQADVGQELIDMGMGYLKEHGIDNSADAIRAIGKGAELQEKELGWAAIFAELANASQDDLDRKLRKFMTDEVETVEGKVIDAPTDEPEDKVESDE
jgi:hypothetical protein